MSGVCFIDTETTGVHDDSEVWEVGLIVRGVSVHEDDVQRDEYGDALYRFLLPVTLVGADPEGLRVSEFHRRHPQGDDYQSDPTIDLTTTLDFAHVFMSMTAGMHWVGAVPNFDEIRLRRMLRGFGFSPGWHYHLIDVENLAAGYLAYKTKFMQTAQPLQFPEGMDAESWQELALVAQRVATVLPWDSDELSLAVGVDPSRFHRHSALGDAMWARALFDRVMGGPTCSA